MTTISTDAFLAWAGLRGVILDTRYGPPQCLVYAGDAGESRFWACRQLLQTDHHGVVYVACTETARLTRFIRHMAHGGYPLPTEPPDATFKRPEWMGCQLDQE